MKKILNCILVLIITILLIPNVFAANNVVIESIKLEEKSKDLIELSKPTINGMNLGFDLAFLNKGDKAKYEVIISNNSNKDFYIDNQTKFNKSNYITYTYEFDDKEIKKIEPNSKLKMYITIEYTTLVPPQKLVNGMYTEDNEMSMDLTDVIITNPKTYSNIITLLLIFITLIVITIFKLKKKKRIGINLLLIGLLLIPITTYALERITIKATTKITIEEQRNKLASRFEGQGLNNNHDFWYYYSYIKNVTFETQIKEPSNYSYKYDVSEAKNNSIIAYLIPNEKDNMFFDLYIMSNGYIYANPDSSYVFYGFNNMSAINNIENYKTYYAETMKGMFEGAISIEKLDLSSWNTSKVTDMSGMFLQGLGSGDTGILKDLDISSFDTSKVTDMSSMFQLCFALTEIDVSHFDTSNVTNMNLMFKDCRGITELDVSHFDTSKVTDMNGMFCYCRNLENLDVSHFNTSKVTNMYSMFNGCEKLTSLDVSNFDTSQVTNMWCTFQNLKNLLNLDVSRFDTSKVTNMRGMFNGCEKLTSLDLTHFDTSNVDDMSYMLRNELAMKTMDLSSFNTSNVTNMSYMFEDDENLETIYVSNQWNTSNITSSNSYRMFNGCVKLPNFDPYYIDKTRANTSSTGYLTLKS